MVSVFYQPTKKKSGLNLKSTKGRCPLWSSPVFCYAALQPTNNCLGNNIALIEVFLWPKKKTEMEEYKKEPVSVSDSFVNWSAVVVVNGG